MHSIPYLIFAILTTFCGFIYFTFQGLNGGLAWSDLVVPALFIIITVFNTFRLLRAYKSKKDGTAIDDELTRKTIVYASARMFPIALIIWVLAMLLVEQKVLEFNTSYILAMVLSIAGFWIVFQYYKKNGFVNEE